MIGGVDDRCLVTCATSVDHEARPNRGKCILDGISLPEIRHNRWARNVAAMNDRHDFNVPRGELLKEPAQES